jgi:hypothetical protein
MRLLIKHLCFTLLQTSTELIFSPLISGSKIKSWSTLFGLHKVNIVPLCNL